MKSVLVRIPLDLVDGLLEPFIEKYRPTGRWTRTERIVDGAMEVMWTECETVKDEGV